MATARHAEGPWTHPLGVVAEAGLEDPCPFRDEDGKAWLIHGQVGAGPLIPRRMGMDGTRVLDAGTIVVEGKARLPVLEGPKLYKRHGRYYIFAPIGGVMAGPQVVGPGALDPGYGPRHERGCPRCRSGCAACAPYLLAGVVARGPPLSVVLAALNCLSRSGCRSRRR